MSKYLTFLIPIIFFVGCANEDDDASTSGDFDGTWNVTFMGDYANADCSGDVDTTGWALSAAFGISQVLEIDGDSYTMTVSMVGQVMESLSGTFSENEGSPCLDGECISINWITPGSVWSMDIESDAYCEDSNLEETSDTTQQSCEANGDGYDWYPESCTQSVYTKE